MASMPASPRQIESAAQPLNPAWPAELARADLVRLRCSLDFSAPCRLDAATLLGLRRPLRLAARQALTGRDGEARFQALFEAVPSSDPVAVKRYQKPAPAFVIKPPPEGGRAFDAGDRFELEVLFLGTGIPSIGDFLLGLERLGQIGLAQGEGQFELAEVCCLDVGGRPRTIWRQGQAFDALAPDLLPLDLWLEQRLPQQAPLELALRTPARLLTNGKPLRRPDFARIFPFLLRRVTTQLYAHCGLEPVGDPQPLLAAAAAVAAEARLAWEDWRAMAGQGEFEAVGGLTGVFRLDGAALEEILWVLGLASLLGIGKGAAYGAGQLQLRVAPSL